LNGEKDIKKETQTVEFKQSWHDGYLKWICGFAAAHSGGGSNFCTSLSFHFSAEKI